MSSTAGWIPGRIVSIIMYILSIILTNSYPSYLYPDGRSINPDLSWAVQATPEDHVKVRYNLISYVNGQSQVGYCFYTQFGQFLLDCRQLYFISDQLQFIILAKISN